MKLLFLTQGVNVPAARIRVQQYIPYFERAGVQCFVRTIYPDVYSSDWGGPAVIRTLTRKSKLVTISQLIQRLLVWPLLKKMDAIIIQRPLLGISRAFLEEAIARVNPRIVFDMDDAIFYHDDPTIARIYSHKAERILRASAAATCGNSYLKDYAGQFTTAYMVPTTVDAERIKPRLTGDNPGKIRIGWLGLHSNFPYLQAIESELAAVAGKYPQVEFVIVSDASYQPMDQNFPVTQYRWSAQEELEQLQLMDIGLMPLPDSPWSRGKCGGKLVQYSAVGIASVSSDSVIARDVVIEGQSGFIACDPGDWFRHLSYLIEHPEARERMGRAARERLEQYFSIQCNYPILLDIYRRVSEKKLS